MCFRRGHLEDLKRLCRSCPANGSALLLLLLRGRDLAISGHPVRRRHLELRSRETDRPVTSSVDRHLPATCSSTQNRAKVPRFYFIARLCERGKQSWAPHQPNITWILLLGVLFHICRLVCVRMRACWACGAHCVYLNWEGNWRLGKLVTQFC